MENYINKIHHANSIELMKKIPTNSIHLILSDIPYGIGYDEWDVLHDNTNSAYLGSSPAQEKAGAIFKKRGKPLNGWSEADRLIPIQYYEWCKQWAPLWLDVLVPGGSAIIFAGRRLAHRAVCALEDTGFTYKDMLGWNKEKAAHRAQRVSVIYDKRGDQNSAENWDGWKVGNLRPIFEPILWFTKPYKIGGTLADNILNFGVGAYNEKIFSKYSLTPDNVINLSSLTSDIGLHPTQKPLNLMKFFIELTTIEDQIILDPFVGSGTTCLAALELKRQYIGIDSEESYVTIARERIIKAKSNLEYSLFN